jgi:hypothetical protein
MPALIWDSGQHWDDPNLFWSDQTDNNNNDMSSAPFCYITRPAPSGLTVTTMPKYRGTKTQAEVHAEVTARLGATPLTVENVTRTLCEVIVDWTIACWKIEPLGNGLIGFLCGCGGSSPVGEDPPSSFEDMGVELRGYYGAAGRDRAAAAFSAQKVGEQGRVTPVFSEVYDSESKVPNHYVAGKTITIILANRHPKFDPNQSGQWVKYRKSDGTLVLAGGYPYIKGNTIVANVPTGLSVALELHLTLELNGSVREGVYPFPLT